MTKPRIAVICGKVHDRLPPYLNALAAAGAEGVVFVATQATAAEILAQVDGVLLTGGGDVDPKSYADYTHPTVSDVDPVRDALEKELVVATHQQKIPLLGICRGVQVMGWALGGTLHQHIENHKHMPNKEFFHLAHAIDIVPDSHLACVLGTTTAEANSIHHQALAAVAPPLVVSARAPDGTIEAVEDPAHPWFIGVQCHPEWLPGNTTWQKLFQEFVKACLKFT